MGVLNVTPDSFSDGGQFNEINSAILHVDKMLKNGADIIDIGGESTKPGSEPVSANEESKRIIPLIRTIKNEYKDILISVDTYKSSVAKKAIEAGADFVNDISGLTFDDEMVSLLAQRNIPVVIMHINGKPKTMQKNILYSDLISDMKRFFIKQCEHAINSGIKENNIIIDPGLGFGKTFDHNFTLLKRLKEFEDLGFPILIGPSRKAFIGDVLNLPSDERVEGTIATIVAGILNGANIIRVHDVKEIKRATIVTEKILKAK
ncbi:MAG: dihydropteroate synthase [Candidatus Neomarinimicrobiota bacterium]